MDRVLPIESPEYPARLRDLANPPDPLFVRGAWDHEGPVVAIVGARSALGDGLEMARRLAAGLAREGAAVVSGLARGIDAAAHEGALEAGGRTGAVIGTPLDLVYPPAHRDLQGRVARSLGLMSELPPGAHPARSTFVSRNRMLAAIADLVVLVQGDLESGALRTVEAAERLGRPVGAVPWHAEEPLAAAPHALIHDRRAVLVRDAADVLELAGEPRSPLLATARAAAAGAAAGVLAGVAAGSPESRILAALTRRPEPLDVLALRASLGAAEASAALLSLELAGVARREPGGRFRRARGG